MRGLIAVALGSDCLFRPIVGGFGKAQIAG